MSDASVTGLPTTAILGGGSMGGAILGGLTAPDVQIDGVRVTTRSAERAAQYGGRPGVTAIAVEDDPAANVRAVDGAGVVILAVKPAGIADLVAEIAPALRPDCIVVSVAAGVPTTRIEDGLTHAGPVIRAMPNTPAHVGRGVTGISAGSRASAEHMAVVRRLFETVGEVIEVPESQLDALSTISGSGPAYVFYLMEQLTAAAIDKGFDAETAARLVNGTFLGATELQAESGRTPGQLRIQVTSPKGTTERAVAVLETGGLKALFDRATDAALARARELGG